MSIWLGAGPVAPSLRSATTETFCSTNSSPARRPAWTIQKPARSISINVIVAVAARLIAALRQKPCQARRTLKARNEIIGLPRACSRGAVVPADLVANHAPILERDDALSERSHDVGIVGRHED